MRILILTLAILIACPTIAQSPSAPADAGSAQSASVTLPTPPTLSAPRHDHTPELLIGAALLALPMDKDLFKSVRRATGTGNNDFFDTANSLGDGTVLIPLLGGMYLLGGKSDKDTATLAFAALVNAGLTTEGLKRLTGRERPDTDGGGEFHGPRFENGYNSFPSGHTSAAFAVATVLANRNPKQKWLYYGLASAVGVARIRKGAHFPADVLAGAGVGIYVGNWTLNHGPRLIEFRW